MRIETNKPTSSAPPRSPARGTATMEFALVFPLVLVLALILTQITLLMGANSFVHYSAFAATRAAIVQVPTVNQNEEFNVVINATGFPKHEAIRRAAVYALVPVSGKKTGDATAASEGYVAGLHTYFNAYNQPAPAWINNLAADRLRYADANTRVSLYKVEVDESDRVVTTELPAGSPYTFGPKEPIMVRVTHRLNLSVPYVSALFSDGTFDEADGGGRFREVTSDYTLTNEGVYDALPPTPDIPRLDQ